MGAMNSDPRYLRVRARLNEAALRLIQEKPADSITVSELTREAGVSRTTFYQHGDSPARFIADLFNGALRPYLEELIDALASADRDFLLRWREINIRMLGVLKDNDDAVRAIFGSGGQPVVIGYISSGLTGAFSEYVEEFGARIEGEQMSELWKEMATTQLVHNLLAVVIAWMRTGMAESPDVVVNTYLSLAPPWQLTRFGDDGTVSLKRSRAVSDLVAASYQRKASPKAGGAALV